MKHSMNALIEISNLEKKWRNAKNEIEDYVRCKARAVLLGFCLKKEDGFHVSSLFSNEYKVEQVIEMVSGFCVNTGIEIDPSLFVVEKAKHPEPRLSDLISHLNTQVDLWYNKKMDEILQFDYLKQVEKEFYGEDKNLSIDEES